MTTEISQIWPVDALNIADPTMFVPGTLLGDRYMTYVKPEYSDTYRDAASLLLSGYVNPGLVNPKDNLSVRTVTSFGIATVNVQTAGGEATTVIIPTGQPHMLDAEILDIQDQIHAFHQGLIVSVNRALFVLNSNYRFAEVPEL